MIAKTDLGIGKVVFAIFTSISDVLLDPQTELRMFWAQSRPKWARTGAGSMWSVVAASG